MKNLARYLELKINTLPNGCLQSSTEVLKESGNFHKFYDNYPGYVCILQGTKICYTNKVMQKMLKYSEKELLELDFWELVHPDYRKRLKEHYVDRLQGQEGLSRYEIIVMDKEHREYWIDMHTNIIEYEGKAAVIISAYDITARKLLESELIKSEAKFRKLLDTAPGLIWVFQGDKFCYVNEKFRLLLEYSIDELLEMEHWMVFHQQCRDIIKKRGMIRQDGKPLPSRYEARVVSKTGKEYWIDMSADIIEYEGKPAVIVSASDITRQKATQEALSESESKFRKLAETAPAFIFLLQRYRFLYINSWFCSMTGFSEAELLKMYALDVVHPEFRDFVEERLLDLQYGKLSEYRFDIKILKKDGGSIWIDMAADFIKLDGIPSIIGTGYDITAKKGLEEALIKSEEKFRQLADTAPSQIFLIQNYRFLYTNAAFRELTEYSIEELKELHTLDVMHPNFKERMQSSMMALQKGYFPVFRGDFKVISKSGKEYWIDYAASCMELDGKPAIIATAYDISAHKKIQTALAQSEANFRQLADTAPALIFVLCQYRLLYVNAAFCHVIGYTRQECLHRNILEFFHPEFRERARGISPASGPSLGITARYQSKMIKKDGREFWAEFSLNRIEFNGEAAVLGVAVDITERKQAEGQIEYLSFHDKLTGLYNRAYMEEKLWEMDREEYYPLSLIMGDVNGLKMINDAFGHQQGDHLLRLIAGVLRACCREGDVIARWGGDEFVILLPGTDETQALKICERINLACSNLEGFPVKPSIALGLSSKNNAQKNISEVSKEAEDRMYRNKLLENRSNRSSFINSLEKTLRIRSDETQEHTQRLSKLVLTIGEALELPDNELHNLRLLAALHDIGKIAIPNSILDKPGKLNKDEWELMKKHPEVGYRIALSLPELSTIAEGILTHHERWDGTGYPLGIRGESIPLIARILAIADAFDVMVSGRPYQEKVTAGEALDELNRHAGKQFDPVLVKLFVGIIQKNQTNL